MSLEKEVARRRTFAIISHPDAGKTTLTEKLLLYGGAIQMAGAVKARGQQRRARSDWMKVERERGISVTTAVMTFEYRGCTFNLLDTPGHEDFSEDTYRTLTAVDSAVMVLDAAKGIERQTRKLFEVCRVRDMPIITFVNKLDREGRDPFEVLDEIEQDLQLEVTPASWPIGMGRSFLGCYDLVHDELVLMEKGKGLKASTGESLGGVDDPRLDERLPADAVACLREEVDMVRGLTPPLDLDTYLGGDQTPVFFGSAINNFGVRSLLDGIVEMAPSPRPAPTEQRLVEVTEEQAAGFVFRIQANMDPNHRDRVAFVRLASGRFHRGIKMFHVRSGKTMNIHNPMMFMAREREIVEEARAGDIVGIPNYGNLRIGDALTEGETLRFTGIPSFAPEYLKRVRPVDPMRAKHLGRALMQLAEEGAAQRFRPRLGNEWIVGVAGPLQFEVLADRIRTEYDIEVHFEAANYIRALWVEAGDHRKLQQFVGEHEDNIAADHNDDVVFLPANQWRLDRARERFPEVRFLDRKEQEQ